MWWAVFAIALATLVDIYVKYLSYTLGDSKSVLFESIDHLLGLVTTLTFLVFLWDFYQFWIIILFAFIWYVGERFIIKYLFFRGD